MHFLPKGLIDNKSALVQKWHAAEQAISHYLFIWTNDGPGYRRICVTRLQWVKVWMFSFAIHKSCNIFNRNIPIVLQVPSCRLSTMPSRAPTYYHWSQDKPCTTNQVYGFQIKDTLTTDCAKTKAFPGPFDYTRPFSNCGFFPEIAHTGGLVAKHRQSMSAMERSFLQGSATKRFNINEGYSLGPDPIHKRVIQRDHPADVKLARFQSAPSTYRYPVPKEHDIYLWHTLSGSLVHVKNSNPSAVAATSWIRI